MAAATGQRRSQAPATKGCEKEDSGCERVRAHGARRGNHCSLRPISIIASLPI